MRPMLRPGTHCPTGAASTRNSGLHIFSRSHQPKIYAFQEATPAFSKKTASSPAFTPSRPALLSQLKAASTNGNVFGKSLTPSELKAVDAAISHFSTSSADDKTAEGLRRDMMAYLRRAALKKDNPLDVVEGSMVLLEQMYLMDARSKGDNASGSYKCSMSEPEMLCRWQLMIGTDVGSIQYIPVTEELQVSADGTSFTLDADLDFLFIRFYGPCKWLSPGHLQYTTKNARLEFRTPKAWKRAKDFLNWRSEQGATRTKDRYADDPQDLVDYIEDQVVEEDPRACRPDPKRPGFNIPLPLPTIELFIFNSDGQLGVLRNNVVGLILLLNKTPEVLGGDLSVLP